MSRFVDGTGDCGVGCWSGGWIFIRFVKAKEAARTLKRQIDALGCLEGSELELMVKAARAVGLS